MLQYLFMKPRYTITVDEKATWSIPQAQAFVDIPKQEGFIPLLLASHFSIFYHPFPGRLESYIRFLTVLSFSLFYLNYHNFHIMPK